MIWACTTRMCRVADSPVCQGTFIKSLRVKKVILIETGDGKYETLHNATFIHLTHLTL